MLPDIAHRVFIVATSISAGLLGLMLLLAVASNWINPWDHRVSVSQGFHVGVWGRGWDVRLVFFNDAQYGPYRGSIIDTSNCTSTHGFGSTAGIYYRNFRWQQASLWTFMLSLWYPVAAATILPAIWLAVRRSRQHTSGVCPKCGYDVRFCRNVCSECGCPLPTDAPNQRLQLTGGAREVESVVADEPPARAAGN